jgi:hypothetical protein
VRGRSSFLEVTKPQGFLDPQLIFNIFNVLNPFLLCSRMI